MSTALLPRYAIPGFETMDPEEAAELLHRKKNAPAGPDIDMLIATGAVIPRDKLTAEQREFPRALYREWNDSDRQKARARAAGRLMKDLKNPLDLEDIDQYIGAHDSTNAINQAHMDELLEKGWRRSPAEAKEAAFFSHRQLASDAAISNTTDRKMMSEKALAERDAIEDAADDHIAEIPARPKRKYQRKVTS